MITDFKYPWTRRNHAGEVVAAKLRVYEGELVTVEEAHPITGAVETVERYQRTRLVSEEVLDEVETLRTEDLSVMTAIGRERLAQDTARTAVAAQVLTVEDVAKLEAVRPSTETKEPADTQDHEPAPTAVVDKAGP